MSAEHLPRATGRRIGFGALPRGLRSWVQAAFGPVRVAADHAGGMSPGCAVTLEAADGRMVFVKAAGTPLNPQTPVLFRDEAALLSRLPGVGYRPSLLAVYDDGEWVALALEHVAGRYPDLRRDDDFAAVRHVIEMQSDELTPVPPGVDAPCLAETAGKWIDRWAQMERGPYRFLPGWAAGRFAELYERVRALPDALTTESLCHFDVRDDNLLIRADGTAVILDWGQAKRGPRWADALLLALQKPTPQEADHLIKQWIPPHQADVATDLLVALGGSQAWNTGRPERPSMPNFAAFVREDAARILGVAHLRLAHSR